MSTGLFDQAEFLLALSDFYLSVNNVAFVENVIFVADRPVVDADAVLLDQPPHFAFAGAEADFDKGVENRQAGDVVFFQGRQFAADAALFKSFDRRFFGRFCFVKTAADLCCLKGKDLFGLVDFLVFQVFQTADFVHRQVGVNA